MTQHDTQHAYNTVDLLQNRVSLWHSRSRPLFKFLVLRNARVVRIYLLQTVTSAQIHDITLKRSIDTPDIPREYPVSHKTHTYTYTPSQTKSEGRITVLSTGT